MLNSIYIFFLAGTFASICLCDPLVTTLSPEQAAAVADFPLVEAFMQDFSVHSYNDYIEALSTQGTTIPYVLNNYFLAFEELSNYGQVESVMMQTFPFDEFAAVITKVSWYTELLLSAEMTTYYFPTDFPEGSIISFGTITSVTSSTLSASKYSVISPTSIKSTVVSTSSSTSESSSTVLSSSSLSTSTTTSSSSKSQLSTNSKLTSTTSSSKLTSTTSSSKLTSTTSSSKSANMGNKTLYSITLFAISFLLSL